MKILMVDKYFFVKGGAERYMFELSKVLEANGHEVIPFAMRHPDNFESGYSSFFPDNIDYNVESFWSKASTFLQASGRMVYSRDARRKMEQLIAEVQPDIAHVHMIDHQLSPSILLPLKKNGIPIIQTVHQYKLVCPNYKLYNPATGKICEKCLDGNLLHPITERCHKNSIVASTLIAIESSIHRALRIYEKNIDIFHVPSHFMGRKFRQAGIGEDKIRHLFYTIQIQKYTPNFEPGNYLLYFGRLSHEKGILTLLKAAKSYPDAPIHIVGDGPQRLDLENFVVEKRLKNVKFMGLKSGAELESLVKNARAVIVPSEWYDNSPLVIYESFAYGKPVIAAKMGGMPELVEHQENGLLFEAGNVEELTECMQQLWLHPQQASVYGKAARAKAEREFGPEVHYQKIYEWYQELVNKSTVLV